VREQSNKHKAQAKIFALDFRVEKGKDLKRRASVTSHAVSRVDFISNWWYDKSDCW
jgi:hypothetical protein